MPSMASIELAVENLPANNLAFNNRVYVSEPDFARLKAAAPPDSSLSHDPQLLVSVDRGMVFTASPHAAVSAGKVAMNAMQRRAAQLTLSKPISLAPFVTGAELALASLNCVVDVLQKGRGGDGGRKTQLDCGALSEAFKFQFMRQVFLPGQMLAMDFEGIKLTVTVASIAHVEMEANNGNNGHPTADASASKFASTMGQLLEFSDVHWTKAPSAEVELGGQKGGGGANMIFRTDFDFAKLGIGGLTSEFNQIFRRAFASRVYPAHIVSQMGISHVRGMLLFGPPGCGKTLIARQIGQVLNARAPKIVNGPEVLDKYVGGSEEKIRALFAEAEKEQRDAGDGSMLHIIIFDEIDAICKVRGSSRDSTGVSDSIVNQLLSKIDGVDSLNNVLIIGMTNRKDMIDDALLRPGRLEVHVEIGLPDEAGRLQILSIHTRGMREHRRIHQEAIDNIPEMARRTKNFSGAEIEGLVKSAASYAFHRSVDVKDLSKPIDEKTLIVTWQDFELALGEIQPKFGANNEELSALFRNGIVHYGPSFDVISTTLRRLVEQVRVSERTPLMSVLLEGDPSTGKTAVAAKMAVESGFPFVRMISADDMLGMGESGKCAYISRVFMDSYKSPLSLILIDDIERIIEYVKIGPRFSNVVLQTLLVLLKKPPPTEGKRLLVLGTTSIPFLLEDLQVVAAFNVSLHVPQLQSPDDIKSVLRELVPMSQADIDSIAAAISKPIGIKQLLMVTEMARSDADTVDCHRFLECLHTCGY